MLEKIVLDTIYLYKSYSNLFNGFSNRRRVVRQAPEEGRQVGRRRVEHRLHGPQPVCRSLHSAAVLPATTVPDATAARVPGLLTPFRIRQIYYCS